MGSKRQLSIWKSKSEFQLISIIIPTRNRPELLSSLVTRLLSFGLHQFEIIVVDSSDATRQTPDFLSLSNVQYVTTNIKSAAIQRNIGIEHLSKSEYVFFLDDDVFPEHSYFDKCLLHLKREGVVGVSGVALNEEKSIPRVYPAGLIGLFQTLFLLDSKRDGVLLKSGINIPVRNSDGEGQKVEWLIGCSAWKVDLIGQTRFDQDFFGQSLGEDVIFSIQMGKKGDLVTDSSIVLKHLESEIERPKKREFWRMWIVNRKRLIDVAGFGILGNLAFWWSNFGQFIILLYSKFRNSSGQEGAINGFLQGCREILRVKN